MARCFFWFFTTGFIATAFRRKILIVGEWKIGSAIVYETFNKHPKSFYLHDLFYIANNHVKKQLQILQEYFTDCEIPYLPHYLDHNYTIIERKNLQDDITDLCRHQKVCFREFSEALRRPPFCRRPVDKSDITSLNDVYMCGPVDLGLAQAQCKKSRIVATKVTRLIKLSMLEQGGFKEMPNFHLVYIVRDPRALVASRLAVFEKRFAAENQATPSWVMEDFKHVCDRYIDNWNYLASPQGQWLKEKLILIRYEDFALNPQAYVRKIYKILNIKPTDIKSILHVEQEIYKMTHAFKDEPEARNLIYGMNSLTANSAAQQGANLGNMDDDIIGLTDEDETDDDYSTDKNAEKTVFAWKDRLSFPVAKLVQDESCGRGLLHALGYKIYLDENDYFSSTYPLDERWPYKLV